MVPGTLLLGAVVGALGASAPAGSGLPRGAWTRAQSQPVIDKTAEIRLAPDLSDLRPGEAAAVRKLLEAGRILHHVHEDETHKDAPRARRMLASLARRAAAPEAENLRDLYRLFGGPIAGTLDNRRFPMLPVDSVVPGKAFYPWGIAKDEVERWLGAHPADRAALLHLRTVVRRAEPAALRADLGALTRHPVLDALHPGLAASLRPRLQRPARDALYAVPYAVAWADSLVAVYRLVHEAAALVEPDDPAFAGYLRIRARDLLANDYEGGDAAWVRSRFRRLNAQIGSYETYDDELYGLKASHGLSLLLLDAKRTEELRVATRGIQEIEDALPYAPHKKVIEEIPVGIYDVIADFGETRGTNTATILPNESEHVRRYGRTILMRRNIMTHPEIVEAARRTFEAAVAPSQHAAFDPEGGFYRTLWHEIGHYLGPDRDVRGRELDAALEEESGTFEEMKADLVSLFSVRTLRKRGVYDDRRLRGIYASAVVRVLQKSKPRPDQVYGVMQLMQLNWLLDRGAFTYDRASGRLTIRFEKFHDAIAAMLQEVLALQHAGDRAAADRFIARWTTWDTRHEALATAIKAAERSRFRLVTYAALGE